MGPGFDPLLGHEKELAAARESLEIFGEMVEWSITAVLKTAVPRGTGGSNPSLSAAKGVNQVVTRFTPFFTPKN